MLQLHSPRSYHFIPGATADMKYMSHPQKMDSIGVEKKGVSGRGAHSVIRVTGVWLRRRWPRRPPNRRPAAGRLDSFILYHGQQA